MLRMYSQKDNLIDSKEVILNDFQNEEWLSLHRHIEFKPNKKLGDGNYSGSYQSMWYMVKAYLVKNEDFDLIVTNIKNKNDGGATGPGAGSPRSAPPDGRTVFF